MMLNVERMSIMQSSSSHVLNSDIAREIERIMAKEGFTTGKVANGAKKDSTFVYLYLTTPDTNQFED